MGAYGKEYHPLTISDLKNIIYSDDEMINDIKITLLNR